MIDFKGKKIATTVGFPEVLKKEIEKAGGIFLGEEDYFKDIELLIVNIGDISYELAIYLQYSQVEFYFVDEIVEALDSEAIYSQLKTKKAKEPYFSSYIYTAAEGDFEGIEKKLRTEIKAAIKDPEQIVTLATYRRATLGRKNFKTYPKYKFGDKIPYAVGKNTPAVLGNLYQSVDLFKLISTSIYNPNIKLTKKGMPSEYFAEYLGKNDSEEINYIDKVMKVFSQSTLFQTYSKQLASDYFSAADAKKFGLKRNKTYLLYYKHFTNYYPSLINVQADGTFIHLHGDDYGALFETSGEKEPFANILPLSIYSTDKDVKEHYLSLDSKYKAEKVKAQNLKKMNSLGEAIMAKKIDVIY